jgi:hypothetical protein
MGKEKKRHGCLTAYLIFMLVVNTLCALVVPFTTSLVEKHTPSFPSWLLWVSASLCLLNVVFVIALFKWKKWGFICFCIVSVVALGINLYGGLGVGASLRGLIGIALLFGVLHIGGDKKGWSQLE